MRFPNRLSGVAIAGLLLAPHAASHASLVTYDDEAAYLAALGAPPVESFEGLAARNRSGDPVVASLFTVNTLASPIGVQVAPDFPETGYGAVASDGNNYLFAYLPGVATGTLRFDLRGPATAFGLNLLDIGESTGLVTLRTNAGETLTELTAFAFTAANLLPDGSRSFFGFAQDTPFSQVFLTVNGNDEAFGLDEVYVRPAPAPPVLALLLAGALAAPVARGRRRASVQ